MTAIPQRPPEAVLIQAAREAPPRMPRHKAAALAGISEGHWRHIEAGGYKYRGRWEPQKASAQALARMAKVVGVTADQLRESGRADAAAELEALPGNGGGGGVPRDIDTGELIGLVRELQARVNQLEQERRKGQADGSGERRAL